MSKKVERENRRRVRVNLKHTLKNGISINNFSILTRDYERVEELLNSKVCDSFKFLSAKEEWKEEVKDSVIWNSISKKDFIYGDWWRIVNLKNNRFYYVTISTPQILSKDRSGYISLLETIFDNQFKCEDTLKFTTKKECTNHIKNCLYQVEIRGTSTFDIVKDIKNLNYKKLDEIIDKFNNSILIDKAYVSFSRENGERDIDIVVPFFYEESYKKLFSNILNQNREEINFTTSKVINLLLDDALLDFVKNNNLKIDNFII